MIQRFALLIILPVLSCLLLVGCSEPQAYDGSKSFQSTPSTTSSSSTAITPTAQPSASLVKEAGKYWKRGGKKIDKAKTKRVLIAEFGVVFVTGRDHKIGNNSLSLGTMMRIAGVGRREYKFDDAFKTSFPTELYNAYVKQLEANGYEVIPVEETLASKAMDNVESAKVGGKTRGNYYHGFFGGKGSQKAEIYPAAGLDRLGAGFLGFGEAKNMKAVNAAMGELNADMAVRVLIGVGLINGKACFEPGSSIRVFSDLKSSKMPNGNVTYWPQTHSTVTSKKTLFYDKPVIDNKKFEAFKGKVWQVNEAEYAAAIKNIFPSYINYSVVKLSN